MLQRENIKNIDITFVKNVQFTGKKAVIVSLYNNGLLSIFFVYRLPLAYCSLSNASNNALKFPFPKLFAPLR